MFNRITYIAGIALLASGLFFQSCSPAGGEYAGTEYMPDMGHSIAYESNVLDEYSLHDWDEQSVQKRYALSQPHNAVNGTIPRGYVASAAGHDMSDVLSGRHSIQGIRTPINGNVPYYYNDTEEERVRANREILKNPYPITKEGLERAKWLYETYCGICHGNDGGGAGYLVSEANKEAKYPAQPANFLQDTFYNSNNGRFYHAIMYGKNVMGNYTDKLSYEERWQVIHYIHALQAKAKQLEYSETANTYSNPTHDVPAALSQKAVPAQTPASGVVKQPANAPKKEKASGK